MGMWSESTQNTYHLLWFAFTIALDLSSGSLFQMVKTYRLFVAKRARSVFMLSVKLIQCNYYYIECLSFDTGQGKWNIIYEKALSYTCSNSLAPGPPPPLNTFICKQDTLWWCLATSPLTYCWHWTLNRWVGIVIFIV